MAPIQIRIQLELRDEDTMQIVVLQKDVQLAALPPIGTLIELDFNQFIVKAITLVIRERQPAYYLVTAGTEFWQWNPKEVAALQRLGWD